MSVIVQRNVASCWTIIDIELTNLAECAGISKIKISLMSEQIF